MNHLTPRSQGIANSWEQALREGRTEAAQGTGEHLKCSIVVYRQGQVSEVPTAPQGEEVATVLEGEFRIEAAGELYELTPGEGIIIPPRAERTWTCLSDMGALYRVITRLDNLPAGVASGAPA